MKREKRKFSPEEKPLILQEENVRERLKHFESTVFRQRFLRTGSKSIYLKEFRV